MGTTVISATRAADESVTGTLAAGESITFGADGMSDSDDPILILKATESGYGPITYLDNNGKDCQAELRKMRNTEKITGPLDYKLSKPPTYNPVDVVSFP